jgi:hypothetical protein
MKYFTNIFDNNNWIQNPSCVKEELVWFSKIDYENLIDINSDRQHKNLINFL